MELVNVAPAAVKERKPRLENTHIPSELGIFGPEFACVVVGISSDGYVSAVISGLGKNSSQILEDYFSDYLVDITFLCSDDYDAYTRYCDNNAIPHYVQPSDMRKIVRKEQKDWAEKHNGRELAEETIRKRYYQTQGLDRIENYGRLGFTEFERLKVEKHLTLTDVALIWNKSATSYLVFGALNAATEDYIMIPLENIAMFDKYTYFPGGGLRIVNAEGKEFKFSFKHKKDFKIIWDYLTNLKWYN